MLTTSLNNFLFVYNMDEVKRFHCRRCNFSTEYKHVLVKHLERKKVCDAKHDDVDVVVLLKELQDEKEKPCKCDVCGKPFSHSSSKSRHKKTCQATTKQQLQLLQETINDMQKQLQSYESQSHTQTTVNNIQNQYNTIILNSFGDESYDHITESFLRKCVQGNVNGVKSLIEKIHFSNDAPENKNIRLKSLKNKLVEVADNEKWVVRDADDAMDCMIQKGGNLLNKYFFESDLFAQEIETLDSKIHSFLVDILGKNNNNYFAIKRRILALIIEHSGSDTNC